MVFDRVFGQAAVQILFIESCILLLVLNACGCKHFRL